MDYLNKFSKIIQSEQKNEWIEKNSWLNKTDITYDIECGGIKLKSRLYDINVIGYNNRVNKLHLFDVESIAYHKILLIYTK